MIVTVHKGKIDKKYIIEKDNAIS